MAVKIPPLLHKMSQSAQKAWYKKNNMEMPSTSAQTGGKSAAAAKRVKVAPRKASEVKPDSVRAINAARQAAYMAKGGRAPIGATGSGGSNVMAGSNMSTAKGMIAGIKAGFNPKVSLNPYEGMTAKEKKAMKKEEVEQVEQVDEDSKRMSAAVKLQRAFDREKAASDASRKRGEEMLAQARAEYAKKQAAKTNEEAEQVDEGAKEDAEKLLGGPVKEKPKMPPGKQPAGYRYVRGLARKAMKDSMKKEEVEQVDEAKAKMTDAHKKIAKQVHRDLKSDEQVSQAYGFRVRQMHNLIRKKYGSNWRALAGINEEVEQVDEIVTETNFPRPSMREIDAALDAEKKGNPKPANKLRDIMRARKSAQAQSSKEWAATRSAQKFPVYEPGRRYVGDSVELDGPVIDEANSRNSATAMQQALTPKASDVKAAVGTTARDRATTNKYARRISKLTGGDYSKQDVKSNLMSLKKEDTEMDYIEEKLTAADPASKWISDFVKSDNPKFAGKSKKERINMALGAKYAAMRNEEVEQVDEVSQKMVRAYRDKARDDTAGKKLAKAIMAKQSKHPIAQHMGEENIVEQDDATEKKEMAQTQLHFMAYAAKEILEFIDMGGEIEEWYQNKLSKVQSEVESLHSYIEGEKRRTGMVKEEEQIDEAKLPHVATFVPLKRHIENKSLRDAIHIPVNVAQGDKSHKEKLVKRIGAEKAAMYKLHGVFPKRVDEEVEQVDEAKAVTHEDPLVTVHDKDGIMTHANLSTANHIHGTNVKHTDVHAGPVKVKNSDNNKMTFELSKNHAKMVREEAEGTVAVTPKEKSLAAHHGDPKRITYGDVIKARLKSAAAKKMGK